MFQNKRFYTVYLWYRVLTMLVVRNSSAVHTVAGRTPAVCARVLLQTHCCSYATKLIESIKAHLLLLYFFCFAQIAQALRVGSFLVTQLPGPNYHCREVWGSELTVLFSIHCFYLMYCLCRRGSILVRSLHLMGRSHFASSSSASGGQKWLLPDISFRGL